MCHFPFPLDAETNSNSLKPELFSTVLIFPFSVNRCVLHVSDCHICIKGLGQWVVWPCPQGVGLGLDLDLEGPGLGLEGLVLVNITVILWHIV